MCTQSWAHWHTRAQHFSRALLAPTPLWVSLWDHDTVGMGTGEGSMGGTLWHSSCLQLVKICHWKFFLLPQPSPTHTLKDRSCIPAGNTRLHRTLSLGTISWLFPSGEAQGGQWDGSSPLMVLGTTNPVPFFISLSAELCPPSFTFHEETKGNLEISLPVQTTHRESVLQREHPQ